MAEARTLEAPEKRQFGVRAPRKRGPLENAPGKNLITDAKRCMGEALRLRNTAPVRAARAAERAYGSYLAAANSAFSEKNRADCFVGAGNALSLAASLCEKSDSRRAGRLYVEAGDQFYAGARHGKMPEAEAIRLAREQFELGLRLGGDPRVVKRKIEMCDRASGY